MNIYQAVNYGIEVSKTIELPTGWGATEDGTGILSWNGSPQPTDEIIQAAWEASGKEQGATDAVNRKMRKVAFMEEADPLFFQVQRGEVEQSVYDAKVAAIRAKYPISTD